MPDNPKNILLVDEDLYLLGIYIKRLKSLGWDVDFATSEEGAAFKLSNGSYGAVVLDVMIGRKAGVEVLENFQSQKLLENSLVIVLTNNDSTDDIGRADQLGASGYIIKAHNTPQEIAEEIDKMYGSHRGSRQQ